MSSRSHCAADIIERFTNAAKKSDGGKIWVSMPMALQESFGCALIP